MALGPVDFNCPSFPPLDVWRELYLAYLKSKFHIKQSFVVIKYNSALL